MHKWHFVGCDTFSALFRVSGLSLCEFCACHSVINSLNRKCEKIDKWTLAPGRFKSLKELADTASTSSGIRHSNSNAAGVKEKNNEKAKQDAIKKKMTISIRRGRQPERKKIREKKRRALDRSFFAPYILLLLSPSSKCEMMIFFGNTRVQIDKPQSPPQTPPGVCEAPSGLSFWVHNKRS